MELEWKPGLLTSARTHATLVRSGISERGVAATAKSVGQAVFRKLKNRVGATSVRVLPSPAVDHETPPLASPRRAAFQWRELLAGVRDLPTLAVLVLVRPDTPPHVLRWTLEQLSLQYFDEFSVVVAETGNTPPALAEALQQATQTLKRVDAVHVRDVDAAPGQLDRPGPLHGRQPGRSRDARARRGRDPDRDARARCFSSRRQARQHPVVRGGMGGR